MKRYTSLQKALHWAIAAAILGMIPLGVIMKDTPQGPAKDSLYDLHKSIGLTILCLMTLRLTVRVLIGTPPLVPGLNRVQTLAAHATHAGLYAIAFLLPLTGLIATASCCAPVTLFWTIPLPLSFSLDKPAIEFLFGTHEALSFALAGLIVLHAAAALHHHVFRRDETLVRMLPWGAGSDESRKAVPWTPLQRSRPDT